MKRRRHTPEQISESSLKATSSSPNAVLGRRRPALGDRRVDVAPLAEWGWHGLTDIHQKARSAGEDAHHGDHGAEQAP